MTLFNGIFQEEILNPDSGIEIRAPIVSPIPVSKKGGMSESKVAKVARDAHSAIAPNA